MMTDKEKEHIVIAVVNQKGGVGKSSTVFNLAHGLADSGKRILCIDLDPQASLTNLFGIQEPDELSLTINNVMRNITEDMDEDIPVKKIKDNLDLMPSNIELCSVEVGLVNEMSRERILSEYTEKMRNKYDYILIDCMPSLGMLTLNALCAADKLIIPTQPEYLSAKGLGQLVKTIYKVKRKMNPELSIDGILLTMVDMRMSFTKSVTSLIYNTFGERINVYKTFIPRSVRVSESGAKGISIFDYDPIGKASEAYRKFVKEFDCDAKEKHRNKDESVR